jgi:lactam utilization protein B
MHYRMAPIIAGWWHELTATARHQHRGAEAAKAVSAVTVNDLAGKWVALDGDTIIGVGDSPEALIAELRKSGRHAVVRRIPASGPEADIDLVA